MIGKSGLKKDRRGGFFACTKGGGVERGRRRSSTGLHFPIFWDLKFEPYLGNVRFTPESRQTSRAPECPLSAKSGRTRRSKISYSITARSEVERIALKIGASAARAKPPAEVAGPKSYSADLV